MPSLWRQCQASVSPSYILACGELWALQSLLWTLTGTRDAAPLALGLTALQGRGWGLQMTRPLPTCDSTPSHP